jgi:excisionase family DNA binding protein
MTGGFITSKEVCEMLGISKSTLSRAVKNKAITFAKFGTKLVFRTDWVEAYVARCTTKASED